MVARWHVIEYARNSNGVCKGNFMATVSLVRLENYHMILGMEWLSTLDDILWNFNNLTMKFLLGNELCELQGNGSSSLQVSCANKLSKLIAKKDDITSVELCSLSMRVDTGRHSFLFLTQVFVHLNTTKWSRRVREFNDVFDEQQELPYTWMVDHHIPLKEGATPVSLRPSRYLSP